MSKQRVNTYKRNLAKIARMEIIAKFIFRGYTYRYIRAEVMKRLDLASYSLETLHKDIKALKEEYAEHYAEEFAEGRNMALMSNASLKQEAWEAWERSRTEGGEQTKKLKVIGEGGKPTKEIITKEGKTTGDVRFLELIAKLEQERNKILGIYAPDKKELSGDISFASLLVESGIDE